MVAAHMSFPNLPRMRPAKLRRFLGQPDIALHIRLHEADCVASHGDASLVAFCEERLAAWADEEVLPPPLLTGRDLLALGFRQGPRIGEALRWVRDLQLEGRVETQAEAVRLVRERYTDFPSED